MALHTKFHARQALDGTMHNKMLDLFRKYLLVGGLPEAVNAFLQSRNIQRVREVQREIHDYYVVEVSEYDVGCKLEIRHIYDLIHSNMENKEKRVVAQ
ncbi:MAG: hypothetical protein DBX91_06095 [Subdoligranulum variabile]|nr:MAG: hypothetical protein DBX91_06095 [Subdoligranulum variabile]